jgi:hypothetical protein
MLSKSDYLANARECIRWAEEAKSEANREALIEMAKVWTLLASQKDLVSVPGAQSPSDQRQILK